MSCERYSNNHRFNALSEKSKDVINELALKEFEKPLKKRIKAVKLLDFVEFFSNKNKFLLKTKSNLPRDKNNPRHDIK